MKLFFKTFQKWQNWKKWKKDVRVLGNVMEVFSKSQKGDILVKWKKWKIVLDSNRGLKKRKIGCSSDFDFPLNCPRFLRIPGCSGFGGPPDSICAPHFFGRVMWHACHVSRDTQVTGTCRRRAITCLCGFLTLEFHAREAYTRFYALWIGENERKSWNVQVLQLLKKSFKTWTFHDFSKMTKCQNLGKFWKNGSTRFSWFSRKILTCFMKFARPNSTFHFFTFFVFNFSDNSRERPCINAFKRCGARKCAHVRKSAQKKVELDVSRAHFHAKPTNIFVFFTTWILSFSFFKTFSFVQKLS